jgi:hypothetical protein
MLFAMIVFFVGVLTEAGLIVGMNSIGFSPGLEEGHSDFGLKVVVLIMLIVVVLQDRPESSRRRLSWLIAAIPFAFVVMIAAMLPAAMLLATLLASWHDGGYIGDVFLSMVSGVSAVLATAPVLFLVLRLMGPQDDGESEKD